MFDSLKTDEAKKDLWNYYKIIVKCTKCGREYGIDTKYDNGLCPLCDGRSKNLKQKEKI